MPYIEFRPVFNVDGEMEFDARAYTDDEAAETFEDDLEERLTRDFAGECVLRRVAWTEDQVEWFNRRVDEYNTMMFKVAEACEIKDERPGWMNT